MPSTDQFRFGLQTHNQNVTMGVLFSRVNWSRVGLKAVVLEQSNKLRAEGVTIALYTNGMRVLQILGLADRFRSTTINIPRCVLAVDSLFQMCT